MNIRLGLIRLEKEMALLEGKLYGELGSIEDLFLSIIEFGRKGLQTEDNVELHNYLNTIVGMANDGLDLLGKDD